MIAILMSTYNGEKYLPQQLDSLLNQNYSLWKLYVRDDGSRDGTSEILKDFSRRYPDKIVIDESCHENLGAGKSFMYLLQRYEGDYYMFCDQDDIWKPDKISKTLVKLMDIEALHGKETPIGVFTDLEVINEKNETVMPSLWQGDNRHPEYIRDFYKQWTNRHATYGCTLMFNQKAKNISLPYTQLYLTGGGHDTWIEYMLIKNGILDYTNDITILYRQHSSNVEGTKAGYSYRREIGKLVSHPKVYLQKIFKDYRRSRQFPFKISYPKILKYRVKQTIESILKNK